MVYLRRRKTWQYDWDKILKCALIPKDEVARAAENLLRPDPNYDENAVLPIYSEVCSQSTLKRVPSGTLFPPTPQALATNPLFPPPPSPPAFP